MPDTVLLLHQGRDWIRGSERCLLDLAIHLDPTRFRPVVMCNAPRLAAAAADAGIAVVRSTGWEGAGAALMPDRASVRAMGDVVTSFDVRLMHANSLIPLKAGLAVARRRGIPVLAQLHLQSSLDERLYTGLHQADLVVGVSESVVSSVRGDGLHPSRIRVVYNGVDADRLERGSARDFRRAQSVPEDAFLLVAVTSLIRLKAVDVMIRALARACAADPRIHLAILGGGQDEADLRALAEELGVSRQVRFCGERDDVGAVLRDAADAVITMSRVEAFPLNVLEAGYCGRAVIASDIGPHAEAILPGETGVLVPVDDVDALAAAMLAFGSNPEDARRQGTAAAARVRASFMLRDNVTGFERLYQELLDGSPGAYRWPRAVRWPSAYGRWVTGAMRRRLAGARS